MKKTLGTWALLTAIVGGLVVSAGCLEGSAVRTGAYLPPKPGYAQIDVYIEEEPPYRWSEVGLMNVKGTGPNATLDDVIYLMQDQARALGADAIIVTDTWHEEDTYTDGYGYHSYQRLYARGQAIAYR